MLEPHCGCRPLPITGIDDRIGRESSAVLIERRPHFDSDGGITRQPRRCIHSPSVGFFLNESDILTQPGTSGPKLTGTADQRSQGRAIIEKVRTDAVIAKNGLRRVG